MQIKYLPARPSKGKCLLLAIFMLFIYLLDNLPVGRFVNYAIYNNVLKPVL